MAEEWWFKKGGVVAGPISYDNLRDLANKKRVSPQTPVRCGENGQWLTAADLDGLFAGAAPAAPPPTPRKPSRGQLEAKNIQVTGNAFSFNCPHCEQKYDADADYVGITCACQKCEGEMKIPQITLDSGHQAPAAYSPASSSSDMSPLAGMEIVGGDLTCPHCWQNFSQAHILYISTHYELVGDPVLGDDAQQRFLPTVYNAQGLPLDSRGMVCTDMACPRCHLRIPTTVIDVPSLYISIVGAPGSGKSYFLTAMTHCLKDVLGVRFGINFTDADPQTNLTLNGYERILCENTDQDSLAVLPKTQQVGSEFSSAVFLDGMPIDLPKPYVFTLSPLPSASRQPSHRGKAMDRNIIFYDNAGEHFQPGSDVVNNPATKHLIHSDGIFFILDPTEDAKMRRVCDSADPQVASSAKVTDQGMLLSEMISRMRRHGNMKIGENSDIPLVVVVAKYDTWRDNFACNIGEREYVAEDGDANFEALDFDTIADISFKLRLYLLKIVPRIVSTAESFFNSVVFIPVSVFGRLAEKDDSGVGIRPRDMESIWLEAPMLYLLSQLGFLSAVKRKNQQPPPDARFINGTIQFKTPGNERMQVPGNYAGSTIEIGGKHFTLPASNFGGGKAGGKSKADRGGFWD